MAMAWAVVERAMKMQEVMMPSARTAVSGTAWSGPTATLVGEARRRSSPAVHVQQHVGNPGPRHEVVSIAGRPPRLGRLLRLERRDAEPLLVCCWARRSKRSAFPSSRGQR